MKAIRYSEAQANLKRVMDDVVADRAPVAITRQRGESVVMVAAGEWAAIEETLYLLASSANTRHLLDGLAELDASNGEGEVTEADLEDREDFDRAEQRMRGFSGGDAIPLAAVKRDLDLRD